MIDFLHEKSPTSTLQKLGSENKKIFWSRDERKATCKSSVSSGMEEEQAGSRHSPDEAHAPVESPWEKPQRANSIFWGYEKESHLNLSNVLPYQIQNQ